MNKKKHLLLQLKTTSIKTITFSVINFNIVERKIPKKSIKQLLQFIPTYHNNLILTYLGIGFKKIYTYMYLCGGTKENKKDNTKTYSKV